MATEYLNNKKFEENIEKFREAKQDKLRYKLIIEDLGIASQNGGKKSKIRGELLAVKKQEYNRICNNYDDSYNQLAQDFLKVAEGIIAYRRFHFVESEDAIQEFVMVCFDKIERFDPNYRNKSGQKAKAFNYVSTICLNSYRQLYRSARNYNELKKKFKEFLKPKYENPGKTAKSKKFKKFVQG